MTKLVVDGLEVVEIDQQQRQSFPAPVVAVNLLLQYLVEGPAVHQSGKRVGRCRQLQVPPLCAHRKPHDGEAGAHSQQEIEAVVKRLLRAWMQTVRIWGPDEARAYPGKL